jgi:type II secretory pathway component PulF
MAECLDRLHGLYRETRKRAFTSIRAFYYPLFLSIFVTFFAMPPVFLLSKFKTMFVSICEESSFYIHAFRTLQYASAGVLMLCVLLVAAFIACESARLYGSAPLRAFKGTMDGLLLRLPLLGRPGREEDLALFADHTALALRAGSGLPEAVRTALAATENRALARRLGRIVPHLEEGASLGAACREERSFPALFTWFVENGEAANDLPGHLDQAARCHALRSESAGRAALRIVTPLFVLLNGAVVGGLMLLIIKMILVIQPCHLS